MTYTPNSSPPTPARWRNWWGKSSNIGMTPDHPPQRPLTSKTDSPGPHIRTRNIRHSYNWQCTLMTRKKGPPKKGILSWPQRLHKQRSWHFGMNVSLKIKNYFKAFLDSSDLVLLVMTIAQQLLMQWLKSF